MEAKDLKMPRKMSDLLTENLEHKKTSEEKTLPNTKDSFDKQQSERFHASLSWPKWNEEFRRTLYEMNREILNNWNPAHNDIVLELWKSGKTTEEAAVKLVQENEKLNNPNLRRSRSRGRNS